jgi:hypothetical protein
MQQHVMYLAEPVTTGFDVEPNVLLGLLIAIAVVYLVVRYLKVILIALVLIMLLVLLVGLSQIEPLIAHALQ